MMKLSLVSLLLLSAFAGEKTLEFIIDFRDQFLNFEMGPFFRNRGHATPAREECQGFECPNDNEEGGLFQVEIYLSFFKHNFPL